MATAVSMAIAPTESASACRSSKVPHVICSTSHRLISARERGFDQSTHRTCRSAAGEALSTSQMTESITCVSGSPRQRRKHDCKHDAASYTAFLVWCPSDLDGSWFMPGAAEMTDGVGIKAWITNSQVVHAVADSPTTSPYMFTRKEVVAPVFAHEPTVSRAVSYILSMWIPAAAVASELCIQLMPTIDVKTFMQFRVYCIDSRQGSG